MQADSAVISIGRIRCEAAWNIAAVVSMPLAFTSLKYVMIKMPFMTETPNSETNPIAAEMLKFKPVK